MPNMGRAARTARTSSSCRPRKSGKPHTRRSTARRCSSVSDDAHRAATVGGWGRAPPSDAEAGLAARAVDRAGSGAAEVGSTEADDGSRGAEDPEAGSGGEDAVDGARGAEDPEAGSSGKEAGSRGAEDPEAGSRGVEAGTRGAEAESGASSSLHRSSTCRCSSSA